MEPGIRLDEGQLYRNPGHEKQARANNELAGMGKIPQACHSGCRHGCCDKDQQGDTTKKKTVEREPCVDDFTKGDASSDQSDDTGVRGQRDDSSQCSRADLKRSLRESRHS